MAKSLAPDRERPASRLPASSASCLSPAPSGRSWRLPSRARRACLLSCRCGAAGHPSCLPGAEKRRIHCARHLRPASRPPAAACGSCGVTGLSLFDAFYRAGALVFGGAMWCCRCCNRKSSRQAGSRKMPSSRVMAQPSRSRPAFHLRRLSWRVWGRSPMASQARPSPLSRSSCRACCCSSAHCPSGRVPQAPCGAGRHARANAAVVGILAPHFMIRSGQAPSSPRGISPWRSLASSC